MIKSIDNYVGKEIYIISSDISDCQVADIDIAEDWQSLLDKLKKMSPDLSGDNIVLHGVLSSAYHMPVSFKNRTVFMVFVDPDDTSRVIIVESEQTDPENLMAELRFTIAHTEDIVDIPFSVSLDHTYVFYGYELGTCMSVDEDEVDEEAIEACKCIIAEVTKAASEQEEKQEMGNIVLDIYGEDKKKVSFEGRCLGLISPDEFAALTTDTDLRRKLLTVATTDLADIAAVDNVDGLRLAVAVTKRDGKTIIGKKLLLTDAFEYISNFRNTETFFSVNCKNEYMLVSLAEGDTHE